MLVNIGGIVAYDVKTGNVVWKATNDEASYSSPSVATINGARHAFFLTRVGLVDLDPSNGQVRFSYPFRSRSSASVNAATPLIAGNQVFISASYGTGAALLEVNGSEYKKIWANDDSMSNHYSTCVLRDGFLYGFHGRQEEGQALRCVQWRTGKVMWNVDGYGAGTVTLAGDKLLILRENGELVLAPAVTDGFHPVGAWKHSQQGRKSVSGAGRWTALCSRRENASLHSFEMSKPHASAWGYFHARINPKLTHGAEAGPLTLIPVTAIVQPLLKPALPPPAPAPA